MHANVLLLQGPIGPFFKRFADELTERGFNVWKVNLNGGDRFFYRREQTVDYSGALQDWESYVDRLIVNKEIGRIYMFGDCRAYHRVARKVAKRRGVRVFVFEEGYIRPNYITLEEHGVNGHSPMLTKPLALNDYPEVPEETFSNDEQSLPGNTFTRSALCSIAYYLNCRFQQRRYPEYQHHRTLKCVAEGARWIRSGFRKLRFQRAEKDVLDNSIEHFIGDVLASFARHAAPNKAIVFKHHPMDRAYTDYSLLFENLIGELGLQGRVFYVHDVCLPTLLKNAEGTVLINSTVGMSSLFHGTPVKTLGKAIYDIQGLTTTRSLESFWGRPGTVDRGLFVAFRQYLIERNQINGSFIARMTNHSATGLKWSDLLSEDHRFAEDRLDPVEAPALRVVGGRDVEPPRDSDQDSQKAA